ncbi:hypothetical protein [Paenibacillus thalictri]|uniref:Sporulation membrane protein YtrI C-terminal domain-containing protein n=1 Tax=Paenibacillus thalictri TaxID=2527873 RepID=A0A4V2J3R1_9BACL|nr:hypothetical protein [Paenibacillus thalictri]TBL75059.1 hypothetical protein EYB31_23900 [Paenibacillus thalictri]
MRVPPFEYYSGLLKGLGLVISGAIIGSALFMNIYQHNLNLVIEHNRELSKERAELLEKVETNNKLRNKQSVIGDIKVIVTSGDAAEIDNIAMGELERKIEQDLKIVIGQKVSSFEENPLLYEKLISQRIYQNVSQKDYAVSVKTMVLTQTELKVWIVAKIWKNIPLR